MPFFNYDAPSGGYWMENDKIKILVKPSGMISNFTLLSLSRDVGYFYPYLDYWTEAGVSGSFYLHNVGAYAFTLFDGLNTADGTYTADGSVTAEPTISATLSKSYTDSNGVVHTLSMQITLKDGENTASIVFEDVTSVGLKQLHFSIEADLYPQGYASQGTGGNFNAGGNTTHTVPAPYNNALYSFYCKGLIKEDILDLETVSVVDAFLACYSADASVGMLSHFADMNKLRVYTLNYGDERQYAWIDLLPRPVSKTRFAVTLFLGAWADPSGTSCKAAYDALPYTEPIEPLRAYEYNKIVRTDLNASLYDYHQKFQEILDNITLKQGTGTLVPGGTPSFKFYKHRGQASTWNGVIQDIQEDIVLKSITMTREAGHRLFVEVDILDATWNTGDPTNRAIETDEITPSTYWPKLTRLITPGEAYHDAFIDHVTYLCENYNFYGLTLSECAYKGVDYSAEAKALFIADNPLYTDWPRLADSAIDVEEETLGKWKTDKLASFWDEIKAIAAASNKKFFLMVEPNFENEERQAWEYGQYWPEAIKHCDGLWVWGYYAYFNVNPFYLENIVRKVNALKVAYPTKENIISIGLWNSDETVMSDHMLEYGLNVLNTLNWPVTGQGIEVTPSKYMTAGHWNTLWGENAEFALRYGFKAGVPFQREFLRAPAMRSF